MNKYTKYGFRKPKKVSKIRDIVSTPVFITKPTIKYQKMNKVSVQSNKVSIGTLKKKNYTGLKAFFKKIFKQPLSVWVVVKDNKEIPLNWDKNNRIDDSFYGKEIGFEILSRNKKQYAFIKTFYPENFRKIYPGMID